MTYFDASLDMNITEVETRGGYLSAVKRLWDKHYKATYPVLHAIRDKDADTMEHIGFKSEADFKEWHDKKADRVIYSQHIGAWEGYGEGYGKGLIYHP